MPRVEHIGIAVQDVDRILKLLDDLIGETPYKVEEIDQDRIRTYFVRGGTAKLELLEATAPESPVSRFIERRGPGLHHLAFEVDDVDRAFDHAKQLGLTPLDAAPRNGADGKRIFFLHPKETGGILLEFCRSSRSVLSPAYESPGAKARTAGSAENPAFVHVYDATPKLAPDDLARQMEQRFFFVSIEMRATDALAAVLDDLEISSCHVAAECAFSSIAAVSDRILTLSLVQTPAEGLQDLNVPTLAITVDDAEGLREALRIRSGSPRASVAVLPSLDLAGVLIERHAVRRL